MNNSNTKATATTPKAAKCIQGRGNALTAFCFGFGLGMAATSRA